MKKFRIWDGINYILKMCIRDRTGAIKKFGNVIKREYPIKNYDYVIANSEYWKVPYQEAFNVNKENVVVTGMPRVDPVSYTHLIKRSWM